MSLLKKLLSRAGIGGVKVDLALSGKQLTAGAEVEGIVRLQGGTVEQQLQTVELGLFAEYTVNRTNAEGKQQSTAKQVLIQSYTLPCADALKPSELRELPFTILLPLHTPLTLSRERIWLEARIELHRAADPTDKAQIAVLPDPLMQRILQAMEQLGFPMAKSYLTDNTATAQSPDPFVQHIIFGAPQEYRNRLEAIIATPIWLEDTLQIVIQAIRKEGALRSISGKNIATETMEWIPRDWSKQSNEALIGYLRNVIEAAINKK